MEVIKEAEFGETYFRNSYSCVNGKWFRNSWKEFDDWKSVDNKYYCSNYFDINVNNYDVKCRASLIFWKNKGWNKPIDTYGWFQRYFRYWLARRSLLDERQTFRWKGILSRFKCKLVKMIKNVNVNFDGYSISTLIIQVLLHWGCNWLKMTYDLLFWFI